MKPLQSLRILLLAAAFVCLSGPIASAQIVADGGFELAPPATTNPPLGSGPFSPAWTVTDSSAFTNVGHNPAFAHSGNNHANLGATGVIGSISQSITTMAGQMYQLSFWLANDGGAPPNSFQALFNSISLVTLTNAANNPAYTLYSYTFTGTGSAALLEFRYRNDDDFWRLDDVSVNAVGAPEPGATALLGALGFGAVLLLHAGLRRQKSTRS